MPNLASDSGATGRAQPDQCLPRKRLHRHEVIGHCRFLTFSCFKRLPLFEDDRIKQLFIDRLREVKHERHFELFAWVIMPEHVHLLLRPDLPEHAVPEILRSLKRSVAERAIRWMKRTGAPGLESMTLPSGSRRFWQAGGGYDRNIVSADEFVEKLEYIHANPVRRGLVRVPEEYPWSSARWRIGNRDGSPPLDPLPI